MPKVVVINGEPHCNYSEIKVTIVNNDNPEAVLEAAKKIGDDDYEKGRVIMIASAELCYYLNRLYYLQHCVDVLTGDPDILSRYTDQRLESIKSSIMTFDSKVDRIPSKYDFCFDEIECKKPLKEENK